MQRFPTLPALAAAELDDVLAQWAGLGYYARARNLHRAARLVAERFAGELPTTLDELDRAARHRPLDGGRDLVAVARAAASDSRRQREARARALSRGRRLARRSSGARRSFGCTAEAHTPHSAGRGLYAGDHGSRRDALHARAAGVHRVPARARLRGLPHAARKPSIPAPRPKRARPQRRAAAVVVLDEAGGVLLERRPERGVWGGLYCLPELAAGESPDEWCARELGCRALVARELATIEHSFTHFDLDLTPWLVTLADSPFDRHGSRGSALV